MRKVKEYINKNKKYIEICLIFCWLTILLKTDSTFIVYLLVGISSILVVSNKKQSKKEDVWTKIFAIILSLFVALSNYQIFANMLAETGGVIKKAGAILQFLLLVFCGKYVFANLLKKAKDFSCSCKKKDKKWEISNKKIFWLCFSGSILIYILVFFVCFYPGVLTADSVDEINQLMTNTYSNHHPVYYTLLIKAAVSLGLIIFNNINMAVAMFSIFQITVMSAIFAYVVTTMHESGATKKTIILSMLFYMIVPFNIIYSFTVWKDVLFGGGVLLFVTALWRSLEGIGTKKIRDILLIMVGGIIVCLFRSNGWIAFIVFTVLFFVMYRKKYKNLKILFGTVILISFILRNVVLGMFGIKGADTVESLSIPMQQVSRVIVEKKDAISDDEKELIGELLDIDKVEQIYDPTFHDPIKKEVRANGKVSYLAEHKWQYMAMYVKMAFEYPLQYIYGWVDQTKGYINGGYDYWREAEEVHENDYGIEHPEYIQGSISTSMRRIIMGVEKIELAKPIFSIGLYAWIMIAVLYIGIEQKNKKVILITILPVLIWATLLIATPVFAEFRYVYFMFCSMPMLLYVCKNKTMRVN